MNQLSQVLAQRFMQMHGRSLQSYNPATPGIAAGLPFSTNYFDWATGTTGPYPQFVPALRRLSAPWIDGSAIVPSQY